MAHIVLPDDTTVGEIALPQIARAYAGTAGQQLLLTGQALGDLSEILDGDVR